MIRYIKGNFKYALIDGFTFRTKIMVPKPIFTYFIDVIPNGDSSMCTVRQGYGWDGASGPAIDTPNIIVPSLAHDIKYELMRKELIEQEWRAVADIELREDCISRGMSQFRADYIYDGVKSFAEYAADPKNRRKKYTAE